MELLFRRSEGGTTRGKTLAGRVGLGITGKEEGPRAVHEVLSQGGRRKMGTGGTEDTWLTLPGEPSPWLACRPSPSEGGSCRTVWRWVVVSSYQRVTGEK